jgi:cytochrome c5
MQIPRKRLCDPRIAIVALALIVLPRAVLADEPRTGEQIYRQQCLACHGANGEGTEKGHKKPLAGDKTPAQLARLIAKTMPDDDPGTCVGEDADKVAAFIHDAFYSRAAQARNKPPRIELSRLTVRQYRNAVADLIGTFRTPGAWNDERGLRGEYYKSRRLRGGERSLDRIDPTVDFDFGFASPEPELFETDEFSIHWEGSVLAPESGEYEFIIRTEHAARLWVNDPNRPLIDALVKSGSDTEYRATIRLLGGRAYPIKLDFIKAKQGVDDSKKTKVKPKPVHASMSLLWKVPQKVEEVIPRHNLSTAKFPETFVVGAPFPPDDRSVGYERGTSVSKAWDQATTDAAIEVAGYVTGHIKELAAVGDSAPASERMTRLGEYAGKFAERAFRRPLSDEQKALYIDHQFETADDPDTALKRVVLLVLKSPRFLYRELGGTAPDAFDVASRMSFGLWDSLPDAPLLEAAAAGKLATREQVAGQAERMVNELRTHAKLRDFFLQWLRVEQAPDVSKDPAKYPGFNAAIASDLRTSLDLFLEDVLWNESSDFRKVLLGDYLFLNGRLAKFYGAALPDDAPFQKVALEPAQRAGVVSHPYLMATFAYTASSSPIHRGVFLARSVLGRTLRPPPIAVAPLAAELHAGMTTRERVALQTSASACMTCHGMINPLGFSLEHFDAVGRFRNEERGRSIDATGSYQTRSGDPVSFQGARDLATFLAGSAETHTAFVEQLFHHLVKQPVRAFGPDELPGLIGSFTSNSFSVRKLMTEMIASTALKGQGAKADGKLADGR